LETFSPESPPLDRRRFITALPLSAAAAHATTTRQEAVTPPQKRTLRFGRNGRFKILAITDLHFGPEADPFAIELIADMIATEKPDLVIANGDNIMGGDSKTVAEVRDAVQQVSTAMEEAKTPWAVTLGNHDREHFENTGLADADFFKLFERYPHNLNSHWETTITGTGNNFLLIWNANGEKPAANIWLLDSGKGAADKTLRYEWIHNDQISWYQRTSSALEKQHGRLPSLMFFHIPIREFLDLGASKAFLGNRNEDEAPSGINSGLFAAVLERKDVIGIFCGHDHTNNYIGQVRNIALGFIGVTGVRNAYPFLQENDPKNQQLRGGRVFELYADKPGQFKSWLRVRDGSAKWESWNGAPA